MLSAAEYRTTAEGQETHNRFSAPLKALRSACTLLLASVLASGCAKSDPKKAELENLRNEIAAMLKELRDEKHRSNMSKPGIADEKPWFDRIEKVEEQLRQHGIVKKGEPGIRSDLQRKMREEEEQRSRGLEDVLKKLGEELRKEAEDKRKADREQEERDNEDRIRKFGEDLRREALEREKEKLTPPAKIDEKVFVLPKK